jgi:RNA polymerase sigma-70 factor (ECF subfamily)
MTGENDKSDEELLRLISGGDHNAFAVLVTRHEKRFYLAAWRTLSDNAEAEDVTQEAFLKIWQQPDLFDPDRGVKFTTWFYRVVVNLALDRGRKKKRLVSGDWMDAMPSEEASPEQETGAKERKIIIEAAIGELPERQKTALNLCFYEGMGNIEAAEVMGVTVKALESLLIRAKQAMRENLGKSGLLEGKKLGESAEKHKNGEHDKHGKRKAG